MLYLTPTLALIGSVSHETGRAGFVVRIQTRSASEKAFGAGSWGRNWPMGRLNVNARGLSDSIVVLQTSSLAKPEQASERSMKCPSLEEDIPIMRRIAIFPGIV